jgi:hypothetical protein
MIANILQSQSPLAMAIVLSVVVFFIWLLFPVKAMEIEQTAESSSKSHDLVKESQRILEGVWKNLEWGGFSIQSVNLHHQHMLTFRGFVNQDPDVVYGFIRLTLQKMGLLESDTVDSSESEDIDEDSARFYFSNDKGQPFVLEVLDEFKSGFIEYHLSVSYDEDE